MNTDFDRVRQQDETDESLSCAAKLKALADPTRLAVVESLMAGPQPAGVLGRRLRVEQSLLSHHLRVLREMGLLRARREGKSVIYALAPGVAAARGRSKDHPPRTLNLGCCQLSFEGEDRDR